jgi:uncharacterized protein
MRADFPLPDTEWEPTREYWARAERGELAVPRCDSCGTYVWYPRDACPTCGGGSLTWTAMSGQGRLFAWTVVRHAFLAQFADEVPYVPALVALDEDPAVRIVTRIVDCGPERLTVDLPVQVVFRPLSFPGIDRTVTAPFFTPAAQ